MQTAIHLSTNDPRSFYTSNFPNTGKSITWFLNHLFRILIILNIVLLLAYIAALANQNLNAKVQFTGHCHEGLNARVS